MCVSRPPDCGCVFCRSTTPTSHNHSMSACMYQLRSHTCPSQAKVSFTGKSAYNRYRQSRSQGMQNVVCKSLTIDTLKRTVCWSWVRQNTRTCRKAGWGIVQRHSETHSTSMYSHGCFVVLMLNDSTPLCTEVIYFISFVGASLSCGECVRRNIYKQTHLARRHSMASLADMEESILARHVDTCTG